MTEPISIILADAQYLIRLGLKHLLSAKAHFQIVAEVVDEEDLLAELMEQHPNVVILDYDQEDNFSPSTISRIKEISPTSNILVISADNNKKNIYQVLESGVNSFLTKTCDEDEIVDAVKATAKGEKFFCTRVLDYLLEKSFAKEEIDCAPTPLSPREIEIVRLIARGHIAKEIASKLNLSTHTIYTHRKNIMKKLQLGSSSELVLYAVNKGIVENV